MIELAFNHYEKDKKYLSSNVIPGIKTQDGDFKGTSIENLELQKFKHELEQAANKSNGKLGRFAIKNSINSALELTPKPNIKDKLALLALARRPIRNQQLETLQYDKEQDSSIEDIRDLRALVTQLRKSGDICKIPINYKPDSCWKQWFTDGAPAFSKFSFRVGNNEYSFVPEQSKHSDKAIIKVYNKFGEQVGKLKGEFELCPLMFTDKENLYMLFDIKKGKEYVSKLRTISLKDFETINEKEVFSSRNDSLCSTINPRNAFLFGRFITLRNGTKKIATIDTASGETKALQDFVKKIPPHKLKHAELILVGVKEYFTYAPYQEDRVTKDFQERLYTNPYSRQNYFRLNPLDKRIYCITGTVPSISHLSVLNSKNYNPNIRKELFPLFPRIFNHIGMQVGDSITGFDFDNLGNLFVRYSPRGFYDKDILVRISAHAQKELRALHEYNNTEVDYSEQDMSFDPSQEYDKDGNPIDQFGNPIADISGSLNHKWTEPADQDPLIGHHDLYGYDEPDENIGYDDEGEELDF